MPRRRADDQAASDSSAQIWTSYADGIAELAGLVADAEIDLDEVTRAEGYRHLARILYMGLLSTHDYSSPDDPRVYLAKTPTQLTGGVTSDCMYYESFFDGARSHRLSGTRGTAPLLEVTVIAGKIGVTERGDVVDSIREDTLVVEGVGDDARFEVVMSPDPKPADYDGNWLRTQHPERGRATYMIIRQYTSAIADLRPARIDIEPLDFERDRAPLSLREIETALQASISFTDTLVRHWTSMTAGMVTGLANEFLIVDDIAAADEPMPSGHRFSTAGFKLDPDEAREIVIPGIGNPRYDVAPYWGFQLCNYWFEPLDYGDSWGHLNKSTAVYDASGDVRIVVSEQQPADDVDNWVQLRGHTIGNAQFRLSRISAPLPRIRCEVVKLGR